MPTTETTKGIGVLVDSELPAAEDTVVAAEEPAESLNSDSSFSAAAEEHDQGLNNPLILPLLPNNLLDPVQLELQAFTDCAVSWAKERLGKLSDLRTRSNLKETLRYLRSTDPIYLTNYELNLSKLDELCLQSEALYDVFTSMSVGLVVPFAGIGAEYSELHPFSVALRDLREKYEAQGYLPAPAIKSDLTQLMIGLSMKCKPEGEPLEGWYKLMQENEGVLRDYKSAVAVMDGTCRGVDRFVCQNETVVESAGSLTEEKVRKLIKLVASAPRKTHLAERSGHKGGGLFEGNYQGDYFEDAVDPDKQGLLISHWRKVAGQEPLLTGCLVCGEGAIKLLVVDPVHTTSLVGFRLIDRMLIELQGKDLKKLQAIISGSNLSSLKTSLAKGWSINRVPDAPILLSSSPDEKHAVWIKGHMLIDPKQRRAKIGRNILAFPLLKRKVEIAVARLVKSWQQNRTKDETAA